MKPKLYRLIHSQEMVRFMWKYTLHMQSTQIPCAVVFSEALDFRLLARAVNLEIRRNDCMRLRLTRQGTQIREYFLEDSPLEKILVKNFDTEEAQEAFFNADAAKKLNVFKGETFRVVFFRSWDGGSGIYLCVSHMIMDAMATFLFFKDLMEVYDALKANAPLPKPLAMPSHFAQPEPRNTRISSKTSRRTPRWSSVFPKKRNFLRIGWSWTAAPRCVFSTAPGYSINSPRCCTRRT